MKESNELFELCRQVYEATGWENDPYIKHLNKAPKYEHRYGNASIYTSDYLLEKLPATLDDEEGDAYTLTVRKVSDSWLANYTFDNVAMWHRYGNTPLKSLLKLTIALSEAGELK